MKSKMTHSIYYRNLLSMLIVAVAALVLAGIIFLRQLSAIMMNQQESLWSSQLRHTEELVDSFLTPYQNLPVSLSSNSQLRPYQFQKDHRLTYADVKMELEKYNALFTGNGMLFYHFLSSDVIVTQSGTYSRDCFGRTACIFQKIPYEELWEMLESPSHQFLPESGFSLSAGRLEMNAITLIFPVSSGTRPYASLMVVVKSDLLRQTMQQSWEDETVILLDGENNVLLASKTLTEEEEMALDAILASEDDEMLLRRAPSSSVMYMKGSAAGSSLRYIVLTNRNQILSSLPVTIIRTVLWLLGIFWVLIFVIYCFSRGNHRMVQDLLRSVGVDAAHANYRKADANQLIQDAVQVLNQRNTYLEEQHMISSVYLKEALVQRMLTHRYADSRAFLQRCNAAGILPARPYCPIMLLLPDGQALEKISPILEEFGYFLANIGENSVCGLLSEAAPGGVEELYDRIREKLGMDLSLCYGSSVDSVDDIAGNLTELYTCIPYVAEQQLTGILSAKDSRIQYRAVPESLLINQLQQAVLQNDAALVEKEARNIVLYIREASTVQHQARAMWVEAALIMMREMQRLKKPIQDMEQWNPLTTSVLDSREKMAEGLEALTADLVKWMQYALRSGKELWLEEILTYVNLHYKDEDFSIIHISDAFGMSVTAFSNKFKTLMGETFLGYVSSLKIAWAKELLLTTDFSLQEISDYLHYSSQSNFGRMFKNLTGMTPSVFREKNGKKN